MGLTNRKVWLIVIAMVVSLGGLVALQASLMSDALESNDSLFRKNVIAALHSVALRLEVDEATYATLNVFGNTNGVQVFAQVSDSDRVDFPPFPTNIDSVRAAGNSVTITHDVELGGVSAVAAAGSGFSPDIGFRNIDVERYRFPNDTGIIILEYRSDTTYSGTMSLPAPHGDRTLLPSLDPDSLRVSMISRVMRRLTTGEEQPIMDRIDRARLDSLMRSALEEHGLDLEPVYGVIDGQTDTLVFASEGDSAQLLQSEFRASLFPGDILAAPSSLAVYFPERAAYLLRQIGPMLFAMVLFMLVVTLGFAYSVRTIIAQRRTAQLMVEFVNNMTHEFKTPISTVALACEAIVRPDVIGDSDKVARFSGMIRDENRRMRRQAEKILQMAALEEKEERIKPAPVDLHTVIGNAVESIALQVEARGGRILCDLESRSPEIMADELHLTGIIYNLLDNANKYSPETPHITVRTSDDPEGVVVAIEDNGMGMRPEDKKRIFQKYFRVSHGNRHDIKGFGLGLSYVQLMMKAHRGRIAVESEPGQGTLVKLWFPRPAAPETGRVEEEA